MLVPIAIPVPGARFDLVPSPISDIPKAAQAKHINRDRELWHRPIHEERAIIGGACKAILRALNDLLRGVGVFTDWIMIGRVPIHPRLA